MVAVSLDSAIAKLEATTQKARNEGVEELRNLLHQGRGSQIDILKDDVLHKTCEALFQIVRRAKPAFLKSSTTTARGTASHRLEVTAAALRLLLEVGASKLKYKTAFSILEHVVATLPIRGGGLCEPIRNDYLKAFRILLEQPSNGEHFKPKQWQSYVDFVIDSLHASDTAADDDDADDPSQEMSVSFRSGQISSTRATQSSVGQHHKKVADTHLDDLLEALKCLTALTNAPVTTRAKEICETAIVTLHSSSRAQDSAWETINNVYMILVCENLGLTREILTLMLPLIKELWTTRSTALKEEMLSTLVICRDVLTGPGFESPVGNANEVEDLLETMVSEFVSRNEKDILQIHDLDFRANTYSRILRVKSFCPNSAQALTDMSVLSVLASLLLRIGSRQNHAPHETGSTQDSRKRRKLNTPLQDIIDRCSSGGGPGRVAYIQVLVFVVEQAVELPEVIITSLEALSDGVGADEGLTVSWSFLLLASIVQKLDKASLSQFDKHFESICNAISRGLSNASTCRMACWVLNVIIKTQSLHFCVSVPFLTSSIFPNGSSGPSVLTDTSLLLLTDALLCDCWKQTQAFEGFALKTINWLRLFWTLPPILDRLHNAQLAREANVEHIHNLLVACSVGSCFSESYNSKVFSSPLAQFCTSVLETVEFGAYLLDMDAWTTSEELHIISPKNASVDQAALRRLHAAITDLLALKAEDFYLSWNTLATERRTNISEDVVSIVASLCIVHQTSSTYLLTPVTINSTINQLWTSLLDHAVKHNLDKGEFAAPSLSEQLLHLRSQDCQIQQRFVHSRKSMVFQFSGSLREAKDSQRPNTLFDLDIMDSTTPVSTQSIQPGTNPIKVSRRDLPATSDINAVSGHYLACLTFQVIQLEGEEKAAADMSRSVIDHLLSRDDFELLTYRTAATSYFEHEAAVSRVDAGRLLERLGRTFLEHQSFDRCEVALCFCLRILKIFARLWTLPDEDNLGDKAYDIYAWFIDTALAKRIASSKVLADIGKLLGVVLTLNPSYGSEDLPSPRTSLLNVLSDGNHHVKYHLAHELVHLFDGYVLGEHESLLQDVVEKLPNDADSLEGIATRISVLTDLGSRWHTLLRLTIYHVFETAAHVAPVSALALRSLKKLCTALDIETPTKLFALFCSQIIYTWFETSDCFAIPFAAFGYDTLAALCRDNIGEFVAQIALRSSATHVDALCSIIGEPWQKLLVDHFGRAEGYAIASETSSKTFQGAESTMRKQLGPEEHSNLLTLNIAEVIATFFEHVKNDEDSGSGLEQDEVHPHAFIVWTQICQRSKSDARLPDRQQPCFKVKYISHWLQYLYNKTSKSSSDVWDSALFIYVCRRLLKDATLPLGPLHACAVLRKLRLLIAIAGERVVSGYALEMVLRNLAPFIKSFHCAEDTVGIIWYLLDSGKSYLTTNPHFTAELNITLFLYLSDFANTPQDSTTQELQFAATMSKASAFREWLKEYVIALSASLDDSDVRHGIFHDMLQSAGAVSGPVTSSRETPGGTLLRQLLDDQCSAQPLLNGGTFEKVLLLLCREFEITAEPQTDILQDHLSRVRCAPILYSALSRVKFNPPFRAWATTAIGLTWPRHGLSFPQKELHPNQPGHDNLHHASHDQMDSYSSLWKTVAEQLHSNDALASTTAETALQNIATTIQHGRLSVVSNLDPTLLRNLSFTTISCPDIHTPWYSEDDGESFEIPAMQDPRLWATTLGVKLCLRVPSDPVLPVIGAVLRAIPSSTSQCLPAIVHLALVDASSSNSSLKANLTQVLMSVLRDDQSATTYDLYEQKRLAIRVIFYLRRCLLPKEATMADRNRWLDIDYLTAATASVQCSDYHAALLLAEIADSQRHLAASRSSRRSSAAGNEVPADLQSEIFQNLDDPDFFYGAHEEGGIDPVVRKLDHEKLGDKALSFHSAIYDADSRLIHGVPIAVPGGVTLAAALSRANFDGLAQLLHNISADSPATTKSRPSHGTSTNFHEWNVSSRDKMDFDHDLKSLCPSLLTAIKKEEILIDIDQRLANLAHSLFNNSYKLGQGRIFGVVALLAEVKSLLTADMGNHASALETFYTVDESLSRRAVDDTSPLILGREAFANILVQTPQLASLLGFSQSDAFLHELKTIRSSLVSNRGQQMGQFCLNRVVYLTKLKVKARQLSLHVENMIDYHVAEALWDYDERSTSIQIMKDLQAGIDDTSQDILVSKAEVLTDLGSRIAHARLERPDEIVNRYLQPAIEALEGETSGADAGRVFHNFAAFCDSQLQDQDNLDDFSRISSIRESKQKELYDLQAMLKTAEGKGRDQLKMAFVKAKSWFKLDDEEYQRLKQNREGLLQGCLENYLLSLRACDDFANDTLRFLSLWLNRSDDQTANRSVAKYIASVPSIKFATLMNQLSSRVLDQKDDFQKALQALVFRICTDHPYHGLYQLFATSKTKGAKGDDVAVARYSAANKIADSIIKNGGPSGQIWVAIHNSSIACVRLAQERLPEKETKTNSKISLRKLPQGQKLEQTIYDSTRKIPPPTMRVSLRSDRDYNQVPTITKFDSEVSIAGGVSAPKIIGVYTSDGLRHKMLFKGGNDDLRQDSIMEQVFEQVSNLLKDHRKARQRNLGIRTYKVVPLTTSAGVIEFVQNTIPLHEYLLPAHARYFPKDYKASRCRKEISEAQSKSHSQRLQTYRTVTANFRPVMRFFFMERYLDPDEWFEKRLSYSRTTAAISILGHVLGLGDRHGHNILLDEESGEVVHIDLGVAFEAGRVLPVPEVVPFRLTRDLVDGMGLSGVEGVFRRCCIFTLEALRQDQEAIMTILDVLRYDPLYSWSVSPIRLQKMLQDQNQEADPENAGAGGAMGGVGLGGTTKKHVNEPSEADRALTVVSKKLGKSLSVEAIVNELIRQATDETNLAVLYCGWGAYV